MQANPGVEEFRRVFNYSDGALYWRFSKGSAKAGERAGHIKQSGKNNKSLYEFVQVDGKTLATHRVVFAMHRGFIPEFVDHIDGDALNNRIENLREATKSENCCNRGKAANNSSGYKGVYFDTAKNKWRAEIVKNRKRSRLGHFGTAKEASEAYQKAAAEIHGEFAFSADQPAESETSPAPAGPATSQVVRSTAWATGVVEPPKPEASPAEAGSDEIDIEELFDIELSEPEAGETTRFGIDTAGILAIATPYDGSLELPAHQVLELYEFLMNTIHVWRPACKRS